MQLNATNEKMVRCKLCLHPDRAVLERKVLSKELKMSDVAQIVKCNPSTVTRHFRNCTAESVLEVAKMDAQVAQTINVVGQLSESHSITRGILANALKDGDLRTALKALEVELKQLELTAKVTDQLSEAPQLNLLLDARFVQLRQIVIEKLMPYPEARIALSEALEAIADDEAQDVK